MANSHRRLYLAHIRDVTLKVSYIVIGTIVGLSFEYKLGSVRVAALSATADACGNFEDLTGDDQWRI